MKLCTLMKLDDDGNVAEVVDVSTVSDDHEFGIREGSEFLHYEGGTGKVTRNEADMSMANVVDDIRRQTDVWHAPQGVLFPLPTDEVERPEPRGKIYIAFPIRGIPDLNKPAAAAVQKMLESDGWIVHNPHEENTKAGLDDNQPMSAYMKLDLAALLQCNAICLLPGWRASEGAKLEAANARMLNLDFYYAAKFENDPVEGTGWTYEKTDSVSAGVEGIDQEARRLVYGDRAQTYGHPRGDFDCIAGMWVSLLRARMTFLGADWTWEQLLGAEQVALMMALLKLARLAKSPGHHDSAVDTIGYMLCQQRIREAPEEIAAWNARTVNEK